VSFTHRCREGGAEMFKSLRERLKFFKKKAADELLEEGDEERRSRPKKKVSKFARKRLGEKRVPLEDLKLVEEEGGLFSKRISEKRLDEVLWDLELALLEADVAEPVVEEIKSFVRERLLNAKISRKSDVEEVIEEALRKGIRHVLEGKKLHLEDLIMRGKRPFVIMFVGVNGTGKTTAVAKIAYRLKEMGLSPVIAAADTFRAGAIEQLEKHAERLGTKLIKHRPGADPAAVAYDAIQHAKARGKDVVLIDTAGRMQTNVNLMDEMKKIKRVAEPDLIIFVGDALAGNDAVEQARKFKEAVGIDGAILTKIDADAKGGAALSIAYAVGVPIIYVGTGQGYKDLKEFNPTWMVERIFGEAEA